MLYLNPNRSEKIISLVIKNQDTWFNQDTWRTAKHYRWNRMPTRICILHLRFSLNSWKDKFTELQKQKNLLLVNWCTHIVNLWNGDFFKMLKMFFFPFKLHKSASAYDLNIITNVKVHHRTQLIQLALQNIEEFNPPKFFKWWTEFFGLVSNKGGGGGEPVL